MTNVLPVNGDPKPAITHARALEHRGRITRTGTDRGGHHPARGPMNRILKGFTIVILTAAILYGLLIITGLFLVA